MWGMQFRVRGAMRKRKLHSGPVEGKPPCVQVHEHIQAGISKADIAAAWGWTAEKVTVYAWRGKNYRFWRQKNSEWYANTRGPYVSAWRNTPGWTEDQLNDRLAELWGMGFPASKIIGMSPFNGVFTRSAILGRLRRLGLLKTERSNFSHTTQDKDHGQQAKDQGGTEACD